MFRWRFLIFMAKRISPVVSPTLGYYLMTETFWLFLIILLFFIIHHSSLKHKYNTLAKTRERLWRRCLRQAKYPLGCRKARRGYRKRIAYVTLVSRQNPSSCTSAIKCLACSRRSDSGARAKTLHYLNAWNRLSNVIVLRDVQRQLTPVLTLNRNIYSRFSNCMK